MARPKKKTVNYFPHMANSGKTLFILESRWGNDGYSFFFKLLESLCNTDGHVIDYGNPSEREFLLAKTHVNDDTATAIIDKLAELGKIDAELWSNGYIWYQNLVDNVADAYKKRIDELPQKPSLSNRKCDVKEFPVEETTLKDVSVDGSTESILKESKVKEIIITPLPPCQGDTENKVPASEIVKMYNEICLTLPKVQQITDKRRKTIRVRNKDHPLTDFTQVFENAQSSEFLSGRNGKWAGCCFDWLMKPENFQKVLEGTYNRDVPVINKCLTKSELDDIERRKVLKAYDERNGRRTNQAVQSQLSSICEHN